MGTYPKQAKTVIDIGGHDWEAIAIEMVNNSYVFKTCLQTYGFIHKGLSFCFTTLVNPLEKIKSCTKSFFQQDEGGNINFQ